MRRTRLFTSIPGIIFCALFLTGLGLGIWRNGGEAFSPGHLSRQTRNSQQLGGYTSHLEFEAHCSLCHAPLQTTQDTLCLTCHKNITDQMLAKQGTHGKIEQVQDCKHCHLEHKGQNFNILNPGLSQFDHTPTSFSLAWHQVGYDKLPMKCTDCHQDQPGYPLDEASCTTCHANHDSAFMQQHIADFGPDCMGCHDGVDRMAKFDHSKTAFPLDGQHTAIACTQCHKNPQGVGARTAIDFNAAPQDCHSCHTEPAQHKDMFGTDCKVCHITAAWKPAIWNGKPFDHAISTGFSLALHKLGYQKETLDCISCHGRDIRQNVLGTCITCHSQGPQRADFMQRHQEQFGSACLSCHDGVDRMSHFDHNRIFTLDGAHMTLECQKCHANQVFKGTPNQCVQCHAEPQIHAGFFGLQCQDCHTTSAWRPAQLRNHTFPLDHGEQGTIPCQTCHPGKYVEYTCYGCHEHDQQIVVQQHEGQNIAANDLPKCTVCHPDGR